MESKPNYWAVIPAHIRYAENLPPNAKLLYAEISSLTNANGYCFAANAYFEELYSLSERTVIRLLRQLEMGGYIKIEDADGGKAQRKIYAGINPLHLPDKNVSTPLTKMSVPPDKNVTHNNKYNNKYNKPPIVPPKGDGAAKESQDWKPEIFAAFWKAYPPVNGKRPAKARALKAWNKLKADDKTIAQMSAALQRDKSSEMWRKGIGIPYASTWLNQRYWEDEAAEDADKHPEAPDGQEVYEQW